jgi:hypothetical protein
MILKHTPYWDSKYFTYTTDGHPSKYEIYFLEDELTTVFIDGNISRQQTLDEIRDRAKI